MGKVDQELSPQTAASRMLEAALQQMDGILHGVKTDDEHSAGNALSGGSPSWNSQSNKVIEREKGVVAMEPSSLTQLMMTTYWTVKELNLSAYGAFYNSILAPGPPIVSPEKGGAAQAGLASTTTLKGGDSSSSSDSPSPRSAWQPSGSSQTSSSEQRASRTRQQQSTRDAGQDFQWASNPFHNVGRNRRSLDMPRRSRRERDFKSQSCLGHGHQSYLSHPGWQQPCYYHSQQLCCAPSTPRCSSWDLCLLGKGGADMEERLLRLEGERDALRLQVQVLGEQLASQADKIADLSECLDEKRHQLKSAENLLQREMLTRSSLETQKLELMSAISELKLAMAGIERENLELREERRRMQSVRQPATSRTANPFAAHDHEPSPNPFGASSTPLPHAAVHSASPSLSPVVSNSLRRELLNGSTRRNLDQFSSLPRQKIAEFEAKRMLSGNRKLAFLSLKNEKSYSAPNLADGQRMTQRQPAVELDLAVPVEIKPGKPFQSGGRGFQKLITKLRRSHSGNVNDLDGELRRGGIRATAGPRLGGPVIRIREIVDLPLSQWNKDQVCAWLEELGLENYAADARRWVQGGAHLLASSPQELEKELGVKNPLHKKKLLLAIQALQGPQPDELLAPAGLLDTHWVLRWLDDIGLPQYKDVFLTGRVDGRVLHRLTMDDLSTLHVTSLLHIASLRRGIQVLREYKMDGNCLTRRSIPDEESPSAKDIALWTSHRVMEWLRAVDLAEYAPNLRGSGVHGALIIHEEKFNAELLATLLSIPPSKTLLRRHLTTHFNDLIGRELVQQKREAETTLGYVPLTPSAKIKVQKRSQFTLKRKKSKSELDFGDLVCPLNAAAAPGDDRSSGDGMMSKRSHVPDVCPLTDSTIKNSPISARQAAV